MSDFVIAHIHELAGGIACVGLGVACIAYGLLYTLAPARSLTSKRIGTNAKTVSGVRREGLWLVLGGAGFIAVGAYLLITLPAE